MALPYIIFDISIAKIAIIMYNCKEVMKFFRSGLNRNYEVDDTEKIVNKVLDCCLYKKM